MLEIVPTGPATGTAGCSRDDSTRPGLKFQDRTALCSSADGHGRSWPCPHCQGLLVTRKKASRHAEVGRTQKRHGSSPSYGQETARVCCPAVRPDQCLHPGVRCTHAHMYSHVYTRTDMRTHSEPLLWTLGRATGPAQSWPLRSGSRCPRESHRDHSGKVGSRLPPAWRMGPAPKLREHSRERGAACPGSETAWRVLPANTAS